MQRKIVLLALGTAGTLVGIGCLTGTGDSKKTSSTSSVGAPPDKTASSPDVGAGSFHIGALAAIGPRSSLPQSPDTCTCSGTGLNGPVTVSCGGSTCGQNHLTYDCTASGWMGTGVTCGVDAGEDAATGCGCSGTGLYGAVTVSCGGSTCGDNHTTYACSASGWSGTGQTCGVDAGDDGGSSCTCTGAGLDGVVTVACGGSTCGQNNLTYTCSASGWSGTAQSCGVDAGDDAGSGCSCSGTGLDGPVTVACGGSTCGTNHTTYACTASGWAGTGRSCGDAAGVCNTGSTVYLAMVAGENQVIPVGTFANFTVEALDCTTGSPVSGVSVLFQEPGQDSGEGYIRITDSTGQGSATNFVNGPAGSYTETAAIVASSYTGDAGFIPASEVPIVSGLTVTFAFTQQ